MSKRTLADESGRAVFGWQEEAVKMTADSIVSEKAADTQLHNHAKNKDMAENITKERTAKEVIAKEVITKEVIAKEVITNDITLTDIQFRPMTMEDYAAVFDMWQSISGFGIRTVDDSEGGIARFLARNPGLSVVALHEGRIIGGILCGHDGRRGCLYHVCVRAEYRMLGIGQEMVALCKEALRKEGVNKINLIAFQKNAIGNRFWQKLHWKHRADCNYYEENLNEKNVTNFIQ